MFSLPLQPRTILCLGAHADDIEIGCGGTILALLRQQPGIHVHWVVFSGNELRRQEARQSYEAFTRRAATRELELADFRDAHFPYQGADLKSYFAALAQRVQPDVIFTHRREDLHQDHRTLADLSWNHFRSHLLLEYEIPKYEGDLGTPNFFLPLAEDICREKIELLESVFPSQQGKPWFDGETFRALLRLRGLECNSPTRFAEAFTCRKATCSL